MFVSPCVREKTHSESGMRLYGTVDQSPKSECSSLSYLQRRYSRIFLSYNDGEFGLLLLNDFSKIWGNLFWPLHVLGSITRGYPIVLAPSSSNSATKLPTANTQKMTLSQKQIPVILTIALCQTTIVFVEITIIFLSSLLFSCHHYIFVVTVNN